MQSAGSEAMLVTLAPWRIQKWASNNENATLKRDNLTHQEFPTNLLPFSSANR